MRTKSNRYPVNIMQIIVSGRKNGLSASEITTRVNNSVTARKNGTRYHVNAICAKLRWLS